MGIAEMNAVKFIVTIPPDHPFNNTGFTLREEVFVGATVSDMAEARLKEEGYKVECVMCKLHTIEGAVLRLRQCGTLP